MSGVARGLTESIGRRENVRRQAVAEKLQSSLEHWAKECGVMGGWVYPFLCPFFLQKAMRCDA